MDIVTWLLAHEDTEEMVKEAISLGFEPIVVNELPPIGDKHKLYLVPRPEETESDIHDEFIWIESAQTYEPIGSTGISIPTDATNIEYDNSDSGLDAENVQDALDELAGDVEGKYDAPSTGIPKTDLASSVQSSLGKADTAVQSDQYASFDVGGTIKTGLGTGIGNQQNEGRLIASIQTEAAYNSASSYSFVSKGILNILLNAKENKGMITISGVEKTANTHTVTVVTNGVTSTFTLVGVS